MGKKMRQGNRSSLPSMVVPSGNGHSFQVALPIPLVFDPATAPDHPLVSSHVLVDLPAEVVLAIIGALLDKVVARLGLLLSGDVVVEERVGAERVFVAVAHVALQALS